MKYELNVIIEGAEAETDINFLLYIRYFFIPHQVVVFSVCFFNSKPNPNFREFASEVFFRHFDISNLLSTIGSRFLQINKIIL